MDATGKTPAVDWSAWRPGWFGAAQALNDIGLATSPRKTRRRMRERAQSGSCKVSDRTFPRIQIQPLS
jgi:hypothetical protein